MGKLLQCDSCGKTGPDETHRLLSNHPMNPSASGYGGDGWTFASFVFMRAINPADYPHLPQRDMPMGIELEPEEEERITPLTSTIDLCPECAMRVFEATGCLDKITREVPYRRRSQEPPEGETRAAESEATREPGRTGWARVVEDKDDDDAR
jgi:hypothetical protein